MEGKILGIDNEETLFTIKGTDGNRYSFTKDDWKGEGTPSVGLDVDFEVSEDNKAIDVFSANKAVEEKKDNSAKAIVAVLLTLFFGFIGTAITRFAIMEDEKEEEFGKLVPTLIHLVTAILFIIPVVGWIIALVANIYYAIQNYKACK